jgi:hypothetical protein
METPFVLKKMIKVCLLQGVFQVFGESRPNKHMPVDMEGYLKVNKIRPGACTDKDITSLIHVKVNDVTLVYLP